MNEGLHQKGFDLCKLAPAYAFDLFRDVFPIHKVIHLLASTDPAQQGRLLFTPFKNVPIVELAHDTSFRTPASASKIVTSSRSFGPIRLQYGPLPSRPSEQLIQRHRACIGQR